MTRTLGAVLAGGQSRRFGSDKAVAELRGRSLIAHVLSALAPQVDGLVIVGRPGTEGGVPAIPDRPAPDLGPLGGLNAALHHGRAHGFAAVATVGCDMPVLPGDLVAMLRATGDIAMLGTVPIVGLWPTSLADPLDAYLATATDRSMRRWAATAGATIVAAPELPNINTPEDLAVLAGDSSQG
ncbi:molybdenum cofactor guanylyltransferase [soil metagenome]